MQSQGTIFKKMYKLNRNMNAVDGYFRTAIP
jgi:hypothetical protein